MFGYLLLALFPALLFACCPPAKWQGKWEGQQYVAYGSKDADGSSTFLAIRQFASYDKNRMMAYYNQSFEQNGNDVTQLVWMDYHTGIEYVIAGGTCMKMNITTFVPFCIPDNAETIEHSFVGAGHSMIRTTMYKFTVPNGVAYMTVADEGCIPLMYESTGSNGRGGTQKVTAEIFGITAGIVDESVFTIPSACIKQFGSFDKGRMMQHFNQTLEKNGKEDNQLVWIDYNTGLQYALDGTCFKMNITTYIPFCVPADAEIVEHSFVGAGLSKLRSTRYKFTVPNGVAYMTTTDEGCIPLTYESAGSNGRGGKQKVIVSMFGITPGIADSSVFTIPSSCILLNKDGS